MNAVTHHPRRALALGVVIAIALLALLPGSWGDALAQTAGAPSPTATPFQPTVNLVNVVSNPVSTTSPTTIQTNGTGSSSGDTLGVSVPAGAMPAGASVSMGVITNSDDLQRQVPPPPGASLVLPIEITATAADGSQITDNFAEPVTITIEIDDIGVSGNLVMAFWNGTSWVEVPTTVTVDPATGRATITATVDHFTIFALLQLEATPEQSGAPAAPSPANTGMGADTGSGATNTVAIVLGALALAGVVGAGGRYAMGRRSA